jgi:hypothetical protein
MRFRVVLAVAALAVALAPAAHAASLPDLPGMGTAQKAVGGQSTATTTAPAVHKRTVPTTAASSSSQSPSTTDMAKTIRSLPGGSMLPVIGKVQGGLTSSHGTIPGMDTMVVLAALGSFAALGSLYLMRRLNRV